MKQVRVFVRLPPELSHPVTPLCLSVNTPDEVDVISQFAFHILTHLRLAMLQPESCSPRGGRGR